MCLTKLNKNKNHSQGRKDRYQQMMLTSQYYQYVQSGGRKSFEEFKNSSSVNNAVHGMLDLAGLLFDAADAINAAWYAAEGDYENAGISGMGIIPVIGIGKTGPRVAKTTKNMFKASDVEKAAEARKVSNKEWKPMTTKEATITAKKLGYEKVSNFRTRQGQPIFYNKKTKTYISPDVGSRNEFGPHNGGVWKMAKSPEALNSKNTRMGTYDANLNRIGD